MTTCELICVNKTHEPISLPDGETVIVGRSPQTQIIDPRCSRQQLELTANLKRKEVSIKQVGGNPSVIDSTELEKGKSVKVKQGDVIYIISGCFPHIIKFNKAKKSENSKSRISNSISNKNSDDTNKEKKSLKRKSSAENRPDTKKRKTSTEGHVKVGSLNKSELNESVDENQKRPSSGENKPDAKKKRKTSVEDHAKVGSLNKSDSNESVDKNRRRPSSGENRSDAKKRKSSAEGNSKVGSLSKGESDESMEEERMKEIAEKLKQLRNSANSEKSKQVLGNKSPKHNNSMAEKLSEKMDSGSVTKATPATESIWTQHEKLYVYTAKGVTSSAKIASFDIDGTIISTKSGNVFAKDMGDWKIMIPEIFGKLKKLHASGFKIVFFTNQMGVARGKVKIEDLKKKFTYILEKLSVPVQIFIATGGGIFRKPCTGMWKYMTKKCNDGIRINMAESFYCGDAAGRPVKWMPGKKKDFSCSDRLFALNIGAKFYTPEEYFLDKKPAPFNLPEFDPRKLSSTAEIASPPGSSVTSQSQEVVVLAGYPACGKSVFAKKYLTSKGYVHVNRDTLGTWQKCVAQCSKSLAEGKSVVIDNTNPDVPSRARYIECAKKKGIPCRCFVFPVNPSLSRHNERFREMTDKSHTPINDMIMNSFKSKYTEPQKSEGFSEILKINFVPKFDSKVEEELYRQFLLDK